MTDKTFDELMTIHEMGQAYIDITSAMGPSPQLLAFVNYDKIGEDNLGLESLNIMPQHEQTLSDIKRYDAFEQILSKFGSREVEGNTQIPEAALEGLIAKIFAGKIPPFHFFEFVKAHHDMNIKLEKSLLGKLPKTYTLDAWKNYRDNVSEKAYAEFNKASGKLAEEGNAAGHSTFAVKFDASGWSKDRYDAATTWLESAKKEVEDLRPDYDARYAEVKKWAADEGKKSDDNKAVASIINQVIAKDRSMEKFGGYFIPHAEAILKKVKPHID